jgi:hypothetical protein
MVESNLVHLALRPPIGLLCQLWVIMMLEKMVEWKLAGETEVLGENLSQCLFVHHKPHMLWPNANPGRRGGKPDYAALGSVTLCETNVKIRKPLILHFVLYWCETRSLTLSKQHRLRF